MSAKNTPTADLKIEMMNKLVDSLKELNFVPIGLNSKRSFSSDWHRDRVEEFDVINFQWDKYNRPRFIINFRSFDHPEDLQKCRQNPAEIDAWDFGMQVYMTPKFNGWFAMRRLNILLKRQRFEIEKVLSSATLAVTDISEFLLGGKPSSLMLDSTNWHDDRLPDRPPPWEGPGKNVSFYHLPKHRVGKTQF